MKHLKQKQWGWWGAAGDPAAGSVFHRCSHRGMKGWDISGDLDSPALTVTALTNCSLQLLLPTTRARLVFLISLSTVLCRRAQRQQQRRNVDKLVRCIATDAGVSVLSYETRDNDVAKDGAINCVASPIVVHSESPEQMQESTKSHHPSGKKAKRQHEAALNHSRMLSCKCEQMKIEAPSITATSHYRVKLVIKNNNTCFSVYPLRILGHNILCGSKRSFVIVMSSRLFLFAETSMYVR